MKTVDVGKEFFAQLTNRDCRQREGKHTAIEFRAKYLSELDSEEAWKGDDVFIELDFQNVIRMGPSWANEVFAYFTQYARPERILKKIRLINISRVKRSIIEQEIETGHTRN